MNREQCEFYSPFAHIEGRYELCRIHSASHGSFDTFIVIQSTTDQPVCVYVNSPRGEAFMKERYPESRCIRLSPADLTLSASPEGRQVRGELKSTTGPLRRASLSFTADPDALPEEVPYGGEDFRVWGSDWSCSGLDLNVPARVQAEWEGDGEEFRLDDGPGEKSGILTLGSYGKIRRIK